MRDPSVCEPTSHLFLPVLEVHDALLRCVRCDVFAYQETVKELARTRGYTPEEPQSLPAPDPPPPWIWRRWSRSLAERWFARGLRIHSRLR